MAPSQRRTQKPRVLFVPAGTAPSRLATLAHRPAAKSSPDAAGEAHRRPTPFAQLARRPTGSLPSHPTATDRGCRPATPLSRVSRPLSLPRLPRSLWGATTLLGALRPAGTAAAGRFAVYQCGLAHGAARPLDWLERSGATLQSSPDSQPQPLPDSPLGPNSAPRQSYPGPRRATVTGRLAGALWGRARAAGNFGRSGALPWRLLSRRQLGRRRADPGTRPHGSCRPRPGHPQTDLPVSPSPPLAPALMRRVRFGVIAMKPSMKPSPSRVPARLAAAPPPQGPSLLACFLAIVADWEPVFPQSRTYLRAVRQALGTLICLGRHTLTRIIWANGGEQQNWRPEYFLFSRSQWNPAQLFTPLIQRALGWCRGRYIGVAIDDTRLHKTGPRIQQAFLQRDPLSPKFYVNLMFGLRFLQASLLVPLFRRAKVGARALPIAFEEVSVVKRPRRKLPQRKAGKGKARRGKRSEPLSELEQEWKQYRTAQKLHNLSTRFVDLMRRLRSTFAACGAGCGVDRPRAQ